MYEIALETGSTHYTIHSSQSPSPNAKAINPKLSIADNTAGTLEFTLAPSNPAYSQINRMTSTIAVYKDGHTYWTGRVLSESEDFWGRRTFTCEGALAFLNDSTIDLRKYKFNSSDSPEKLLRALLSIHNGRVPGDRAIQIGLVTVYNSDLSYEYTTNYYSIWDAIKTNLLDRFGGHIRISYSGTSLVPTLDYLQDWPNTAPQTIDFGKNLLDFTKDWDLSNLATVILPKGKRLERDEDDKSNDPLDYVTVASVNNGSKYVINQALYNAYGRIEKVVEFNDIDDPAKLLNAANNYLSGQQFDDLSLSISAIDLHYLTSSNVSFELLDEVYCCSKEHGLNEYFPITAIEIDFCSPQNTTYTMGKNKSSAMSQNAAASKRLSSERYTNFPDYSVRMLDAAKVHAGTILNQRTTGYVNIVQQNDISQALVISNNKNWLNASKYWIYNINGLGYVDKSYNSSHDLPVDTPKIALTMDGVLVADFIRTGVLEDTKGYNYWNLETGEFRLSWNSMYVNDNGTRKTIDQKVNEKATAAAQNYVSENYHVDLTQNQVFNALTNNGQNKGIYMTNGELYINATYLATGVITDTKRLNYWNLNTGEMSILGLSQTDKAASASKAVVASITLWFTSNKTSPVPAKPKSVVTSTSTAANGWRTVVPAYNAQYPYYFYCHQQKLANGKYNWTAVVYDKATTEVQSISRNAKNVANKNVKKSIQLWITRSSTTKPSAPTSQVTTATTNSNVWTTVTPKYHQDYPYYFYCYQYYLSDGSIIWSDVRYDVSTTEAQKISRSADSRSATALNRANAPIGGVNLLMDTNNSTLTKVAASSNRAFYTNAATQRIIDIPFNDRPTNGAQWCFWSSFPANKMGKFSMLNYYSTSAVRMIKNTTYTVSCWAKATSGSATIRFALAEGSTIGSAKLDLTGSWRHFSWTFKYTGNANGAKVSFQTFPKTNSATVVWITGMKLETGEKATDWSMSPEDITKKDEAGVKYTKTVSDEDRKYTKEQQRQLDESLNQEKIFNRLMKKPNGQMAKGIVMNNGELYINATYIQTNTLKADIIKAGILMDKQGLNKWNLETGYLETRNAVIRNAAITGAFETGTLEGGLIKIENGQINGFSGVTNQQAYWHGTIAPVSSTINIQTGATSKAILINSSHLSLYTSSLSVIRDTNTRRTSMITFSGEVCFPWIAHVSRHKYVGDTYNLDDLVIGNLNISIINGLITNVCFSDSMGSINRNGY